MPAGTPPIWDPLSLTEGTEALKQKRWLAEFTTIGCLPWGS